ncbi:hypothetical protein QFZ28_000237 [Neobacillus niacini]|nr:hypothetical protein [Neobacillus niacini]MDQ0999837.1 hypothetical protein [Neobacillus niacini]
MKRTLITVIMNTPWLPLFRFFFVYSHHDPIMVTIFPFFLFITFI